MTDLFRYRDGIALNLAALTYAVLGWIGGIILIAGTGPIGTICGILLIAHTLAIGAYLIHECEHGTIFARLRMRRPSLAQPRPRFLPHQGQVPSMAGMTDDMTDDLAHPRPRNDPQ